MQKWLLTIVPFFFLLSGCAPSSMEDFHCDGETRCRVLIQQLQTIENRDQLVRAEPLLKKHFEGLVDLMIQARKYQEDHPDELLEDPLSETEVSALLEGELRRIYAIDGARDIVERAQQEALVRLDGFERARLKKRQNIR